MKAHLSVAALVSERIDPVSGRATRNRNDALAVALGLRLSKSPADLRVLHVGAMAESAARDYLALGACRIDLFEPGNASRSADSVRRLAPTVRTAAVVLTGTRASDAYGSGTFPYRLAAALGRPLIEAVLDVQPAGLDGAGLPALVVVQALPKGARRRLRVSGPVVLAVSPAVDRPLRHSHADRMAGRVARESALPMPSPRPAEPPPQLVPTLRRLVPLEARVAMAGHARMQAALGAASGPAGTVIEAGTPHDKARAVLDYLRRHALVDF